MPIINLCNANDAGATGYHNGAGTHHYWRDESGALQSGDGQGPRAYWTNLSHVGLCLYDYERNGYDDSDFHMVVWNPDKHCPEDICFASTRGWSYPCYASSPDATPETLAAYEQYVSGAERAYEIDRRNRKARELAAYRSELRGIAAGHGVPYARLLKLRHDKRIIELFGTRIRSGFKLSLRAQVVRWLRDANPKFATPLSGKQLQYL